MGGRPRIVDDSQWDNHLAFLGVVKWLTWLTQVDGEQQ